MARSSWFGFTVAALSCALAQAQSSHVGRVGVTIMHATETTRSSSFSAEKLSLRGGTVSLSAEGQVSQAGRPTAGEATAASLVLRGAPRETIAVVLPEQVQLRSAQGDLMAAHGFTTSLATGALDRRGERRITLGTTFQVAQDQRPGTYVGHADILIAYN